MYRKKMETKNVVFIVAITIVVILILYSFLRPCSHSWDLANCVHPKKCVFCGKTEGTVSQEHSWKEATCNEAKTCFLCEKTEGEPLGHEGIDENSCVYQYCKRCYNIVSGYRTYHNYKKGVCAECGAKDPEYADYSNFGFRNNYGMNAWLYISGYDFSKNRISIIRQPVNPTFPTCIFFEKYYQSGQIPGEDLINAKSVNAQMFSFNLGATPCNILSNDVIQDGDGTVTIIERVVNSKGKAVIIKTLTDNQKEQWLVPADMLDLSTLVAGEKIDNYSLKYYISFK